MPTMMPPGRDAKGSATSSATLRVIRLQPLRSGSFAGARVRGLRSSKKMSFCASGSCAKCGDSTLRGLVRQPMTKGQMSERL